MPVRCFSLNKWYCKGTAAPAGDTALLKLARLSRLPQVHAYQRLKTRSRKPHSLSASLRRYQAAKVCLMFMTHNRRTSVLLYNYTLYIMFKIYLARLLSSQCGNQHAAWFLLNSRSHTAKSSRSFLPDLYVCCTWCCPCKTTYYPLCQLHHFMRAPQHESGADDWLGQMSSFWSYPS